MLFGAEEHNCNSERVSQFGREVAEIVARRLAETRNEQPRLRMSQLGKPDRQLYYDLRGVGEREQFTPDTLIKFMYGDVIELLVLFLAEEAGHEVSHKQAEVELDGVVGHIDAIIDGVVVDVKSASTQSFRKFKNGSLVTDDPFGYVEQLAGYSTALGGLPGAFLAFDKQMGHMALLEISAEDLAAVDMKASISHVRSVLESDTLPERCYEPEPFGKSGNETLGINCSYCAHKFNCWSDTNGGIGLRTFLYAGGPKHFTKVVEEPSVYEITF